MREGHRLRVLVHEVLRKICGPETEEGTGEQTELCNTELGDLCTLSNINVII
jgi:hypothetical protein